MTATLAALALLVFMAASLFLAGPAAAELGDTDNDPGIILPLEPAPELPVPVDPQPVAPPYTPPVAPPPYTPPAPVAPNPVAPEQPADVPAEYSEAPTDPDLPPAEDLAPEEILSTSPETSAAATPSATPAPATPSPTATPAPAVNVDADKASVTSDIPVTPRWLQIAVIVLLLAIAWAYTRFMRRGSRHLHAATASEETK